jgi:DNA polymerase-4
MPATATIVHLDADAFFVSCELALQPKLRGTKCAVGGRERGIISSASYEARACGVYTPMPTSRALRVCPDLILLPHTSGLYGTTSRKMFALCETLTPLVQRNSIDEGYLDLAPCGFADDARLEASVRGLQARIWDELAIPVSMGIARNKLVSQIASKLRKPRGFVVVPAGTEEAFLAPLDIGKLPGVGAKTEAALKARGVSRLGDLATRTDDELAALFGRDWRAMLAAARGEDDRPVEVEHEDAKSYSQQETFSADIADVAEIERIAKGMIDELLPQIRADGKRARTLTLKVRYGDFTQESAGRSLAEASDLEAPFYPLVAPLLRKAWSRRSALRLVGVRFSGIEEPATQLDLFAAESEVDARRRKLASVLDQLNRKTPGLRVTHGHQIRRGADGQG